MMSGIKSDGGLFILIGIIKMKLFSYNQSVRGADAVKSEVESAKLFVNSFVENPVEVKSHKLIPVGICHWHSMCMFY